MTPLSRRQTELLEFLIRRIESSGRPPSQMEIAKHFGFHQNAARGHLLALAAKGYIEFGAHSARGIRVLVPPPGMALPNQLPLLGRIAAGAPITSAENIEEMLTVDPALFQPRATHLFRVVGRSMINIGVLDGDIVAIHEDSSAESGVVAVAVPDPRTDDLLLTLKRYRRGGQQIHLLSENDDQDNYPPQIYERHEIRVLGRYVGLIRPAHRRD